MKVAGLVAVLLIAGCAIKPPPELTAEPPREWTKPSLQRDCNAICDRYSGSLLEECVARCERAGDHYALRCGNYIRSGPSERPVLRATAITIGIAGMVMTTLLGFGYVTPHR